MTLLSRQTINPILILFPAVALILVTGNVFVTAQGLSGVPQRLEETVGQGSGDASRQAGGASRGPGGPGGQGSAAPSGQQSSESSYGPGGQGSGPPSRGQGSGDDYDDSMEDEMDESDYGDEEMDSGYGDGGYGATRSRGAPASDAMQTYGQSLISMMGDLDLGPLFAPAQEVMVEGGPVLGRESEQAFKSGNHGLALELMFGHMTTEYKDAIVALRTVKYSPAVKRPVWSIRWGVSMAVRGGDGIGDQQPIREGATPSRSFAAGRGGQGGFDDGMDEGMDEGMEQQMEEDMEDDLDMDMDMDDMDDMDMEMDMRGGGGSSRRGAFAGGRTPSRGPAIPVRNMLSAEAAETLDNTLGLVAKVTGEQFKKRFQRGDFGPVFSSVSAPEPVAPVRGGGRPIAASPSSFSMSEALNDVLSEAPEPLPMWQPGIVYLGLVDSYADGVPDARAANIDFVLHFDVVLKPGRNETMQNISRCRLINVATGKSLVASKGMDNWEAAQMAAAGRMGERDYVEQQLSNLFGIIDRDIKVVDMPTPLTPNMARGRISSLIASPNSRSLRTLAEIRFWEARELIDTAEVEAAFDIIGGVDALMLLHGALDERIAMARKWAIKSQGGGNP